MEKENSEYLVLLDILRGYSILNLKDKCLYFRHFLVMDNLALEEYEKNEFEKACLNGLKTEEQLLEDAIKKGFWDKDSSDKISSLTWIINKAEKAASKISDERQKKAFLKSVEKQKIELQELNLKRNNIINYSAENCASQKKHTKLIHEAIFYDKEFKQLASENDIFLAMADVKYKLEILTNDVNIIKAAFCNYFFDLFALSYRDPLSLIKKDSFSITSLQRHLLSYASALLNKLKNVDMPDDIKDDPLKIIKYVEPKTTDSDTTEGIEDIKSKMAKRGGTLKAEDLLG